MSVQRTIKVILFCMILIPLYAHALTIENRCGSIYGPVARFHLYNKSSTNKCNRWIVLKQGETRKEDVSDCLGEGFTKAFIEPEATANAAEFTSDTQSVVCAPAEFGICRCFAGKAS